MSERASVYVMTIFISSLVVDCVNVNVHAYVLQVAHYCLVQSIFNV